MLIMKSIKQKLMLEHWKKIYRVRYNFTKQALEIKIYKKLSNYTKNSEM